MLLGKPSSKPAFGSSKRTKKNLNIYGSQDESMPDMTILRVFNSRDGAPESMKDSNYVCIMRNEITSLVFYAVG